MANFYAFYPPGSSGSNPSIGTNGATAPTSSTEVGGINPSGNLQPLQTDALGNLLVNIASSTGPDDVNIAAYGGVATTLGQKLMAASMPVTLASDQSSLAVTGPLTDTQLRASAVPVSAASLPLPAGASTAANQATEIASLASIDSKLTSPLAVTGPLTDVELRASPVPVSGTVAVTGPLTVDQGTSPWVVDGSGVTQPISAAALPLPSGASTSALQVSGNSLLTTIASNQTNGTQVTAINNFPATQPVSGTVTVVQPTGTNLHAVVDSGTLIVTQATGTNLHTVVDSSALPTGAATAANQSTVIANQTNGTQKSQIATPTALTITQAALTVGTSAVRLTVSGSAPSASRVVLVATPDAASTAKFYIGSASVTATGATRGIQISSGQVFTANSDAGDYYIISDTAAQIVEVMEQA